MKKIYFLSFLFICVLVFLSGCGYETILHDDFSYFIGDENTVYFGGNQKFLDNEYYFVSPTIQYMNTEYSVTQLGFAGWDDSCKLNNTGTRIKRFYIPSTINEVYDGYFSCCYCSPLVRELNVFMCGSPCAFSINKPLLIFVPQEHYDEWTELNTPESSTYIRKANVCYMMNYDFGNGYYYVDDNEYGQLIQIIPPEPNREGFTFDGWYTEPECVNIWDFEVNTLPVLEGDDGFIETKLYAKWISQ